MGRSRSSCMISESKIALGLENCGRDNLSLRDWPNAHWIESATKNNSECPSAERILIPPVGYMGPPLNFWFPTLVGAAFLAQAIPHSLLVVPDNLLAGA